MVKAGIRTQKENFRFPSDNIVPFLRLLESHDFHDFSSIEFLGNFHFDIRFPSSLIETRSVRCISSGKNDKFHDLWMLSKIRNQVV